MTALAPSRPKPVYERAAHRRPALRAVLGMLLTACLAGPGSAQLPIVDGMLRAQSTDGLLLDAREAFRRKDKDRLAALRTALPTGHPLAVWVDYWDLSNRLPTALPEEIDAFYARWSGTYLEDRLRNDWLLELGRRRDWDRIALDFPRFRMNDDREVTCYALLADHVRGKPVVDAARAAWLAQRESDDGCTLLASTLLDAGILGADDVWTKTRASMEAGRARAARTAGGLLGPTVATSLAQLTDSPARFLARRAGAISRAEAELTALALVRMASNDPDAAARALTERWDRALPGDLAAWSWAGVAKQAALKLAPDAADLYQRAALRSRTGSALELSDDSLAWKARAALRADGGRSRWQQVMQAIDAMSAAEQRDPAWVFWKARALRAVARDSQEGESMRTLATEMLRGIAGQMNFYGALAAESLRLPLALPAAPVPLAPAERVAALKNPGLMRALQLIAIGLRSEGVREWNYTLRGMGERELLAAAQLACDREVWDRCINTSEKTQNEVDMAQRFPMPFRADVQAQATEIGLDPAYVYGLIRQESRFIMDARSSVGASGLMQIMPATARWTAKKIGLDYSPELIADRATNLKLGTSYLKLVLDDFGGSQALAAAAYNAGPGRPRRWREGPVLETAVWAENIPFAETRDYVKKVLSNATYYAALMSGRAPTLAPRLGGPIGPREASATLPDKELP
ncbi:MAG: transglycosylase SLT domain-containing protein [Burkholderiaceae bacterium]